MQKEKLIYYERKKALLLRIMLTFCMMLLFTVFNHTVTLAATYANYSGPWDESGCYIQVYNNRTGTYWVGSNNRNWDSIVYMDALGGDVLDIKLRAYSGYYINGTAQETWSALSGIKYYSYTLPNSNTTIKFGTGSASGAVNDLQVVVTVTAKNYQVGSNYYGTLANAISACSSGGTITVLTSNTDTSTATINKSLTLATNGKTVTRSSVITINSGCTVAITGSGTIANATSQLLENYGTLTVSNATLKSTTNNGRAIVNHGTVTINSGTFTSPYLTLYNYAGRHV